MKVKIVAILTVILFLVVMSVPVYADTLIPPLPTDGWEYWVVVDVGTDNPTLMYLTSHNPIKVWKPNNIQLRFNTYRWYRYTENGWALDPEYGEGLGYRTMPFENMYASNHDIAYEEGSDDFFFLSPKAPPLYRTMEGMDFGTILRNFSAGLIPVLGLLILALSLAKAWGFLRTQLKH